jgi:short-subunit dehydrogenase
MAIALVTGGTSGVGAAFARALARRGYDLVLVARKQEGLDRTAAELRATGSAVETIAADLADRADVARVVERITDRAHPIDLLVNNAGFGVHTALTAEDTSPHDAAIEVMIRSVLVLGGAAGRVMGERGSGTIINVSSTAGFVTMGSYSAIKAWVTSYTEGLSVELRGTGVKVHAESRVVHERAGINTRSIPKQLWVDVDFTVETALNDAENGRVISIPSARFKALIFLARHAPKSAIRTVSAAISSGRRSAPKKAV